MRVIAVGGPLGAERAAAGPRTAHSCRTEEAWTEDIQTAWEAKYQVRSRSRLGAEAGAALTSVRCEPSGAGGGGGYEGGARETRMDVHRAHGSALKGTS